MHSWIYWSSRIELTEALIPSLTLTLSDLQARRSSKYSAHTWARAIASLSPFILLLRTIYSSTSEALLYRLLSGYFFNFVSLLTEENVAKLR